MHDRTIQQSTREPTQADDDDGGVVEHLTFIIDDDDIKCERQALDEQRHSKEDGMGIAQADDEDVRLKEDPHSDDPEKDSKHT